MAPIPRWNGADFAELLALDEAAPLHFRSRLGNANENGRSYGGQLLALALTAASRTVPADRLPTAMQFVFLQGTRHQEAIELHASALQDGKRFSSRSVRGSQSGARLCFQVQLSFAAPMAAPSHGAASSAPLSDPDTLPRIDHYPAAWSDTMGRAMGYVFSEHPALDFRLEDPPDGMRLDPAEPRLRFWLRMKQKLADAPHLHAAAFAYLSDWWLNYAVTGAHLDESIAGGGLYVASLNHSIWWHAPIRADEWLHFESVSPAAAYGRGLCVARVHDRQGRLVASVAQECVMGLRDA